MSIRKWSALIFSVSLVALRVGPAWCDWPSWRGPLDTGSTAAGSFPDRLDDATLLWRAELPGRGCSTPIVWKRSIYLTAPVEGRDAMVALDDSGRQRWRVLFGPEVPGKHRNGSGCNASPVTDGHMLFAYFKSGTLAGVDVNGKVLWQTNLVERFGEDKRFWDHGTSPVLTDDYVIIARMHAGDSWVAAFDKRTGKLAWKVPRNYQVPTENDQCYTTPLILEHDGLQTILVWGAEHLTLHDAKEGKVLWSCGSFNPDGHQMWPAIATPVVVDGVAVICYGRNDRGEPRLHGVRLAGKGDVTATNHIWQRNDAGAFVPTPVVYQGSVYLVRDRGQVESIDPLSGVSRWSDRLPRGRANYYASPLIADGLLYAPREDGMVFVARVSDKGLELVSENDLGESVIASPVPTADGLLIRGERHLFCFATSDRKF